MLRTLTLPPVRLPVPAGSAPLAHSIVMVTPRLSIRGTTVSAGCQSGRTFEMEGD